MSRRRPAFTLIELMIVVAIISILAAVAIPTFGRYIKRSKTVEAMDHLREIYQSASAYYDGVHTDETGQILAPQFPSNIAVTPGIDQIGAAKREPIPAEWLTPGWDSLNFAVSSPHYYAYQFDSQGTFIGASFTATAFGNLDNDDIYATFVRLGTVLIGDTQGSRGLYFANELE